MMRQTNKNIKLIALDMDGTLLQSDHEVSIANQEAIKKAMDKGIHVMISTGRWLDYCYDYAERLQLNNYIVTVNGGEIWTPEKKLLERHTHKPEVMEKMWKIGRKYDVTMWLVSTEQSYRSDNYPTDFYKEEWLKIGYTTEDLATLDKIRGELAQFEGLELTNSLPTNIEVNPLGVNKANGLKRVCQELDIKMDEIMAVGDSLNDIKMIEQAGLGIAMGNAQDSIKEVADYVTDTNNNDGVAKAIERFIL